MATAAELLAELGPIDGVPADAAESRSAGSSRPGAAGSGRVRLVVASTSAERALATGADVRVHIAQPGVCSRSSCSSTSTATTRLAIVSPMTAACRRGYDGDRVIVAEAVPAARHDRADGGRPRGRSSRALRCRRGVPDARRRPPPGRGVAGARVRRGVRWVAGRRRTVPERGRGALSTAVDDPRGLPGCSRTWRGCRSCPATTRCPSGGWHARSRHSTRSATVAAVRGRSGCSPTSTTSLDATTRRSSWPTAALGDARRWGDAGGGDDAEPPGQRDSSGAARSPRRASSLSAPWPGFRKIDDRFGQIQALGTPQPRAWRPADVGDADRSVEEILSLSGRSANSPTQESPPPVRRCTSDAVPRSSSWPPKRWVGSTPTGPMSTRAA